MTGIVYQFPSDAERTMRPSRAPPGEPASIIIMPVVRIERNPDDPIDGPRGRRRRRRQLPGLFVIRDEA